MSWPVPVPVRWASPDLDNADDPAGKGMRSARNALSLVSRSLWVWLTAIAVLTIAGFAV